MKPKMNQVTPKAGTLKQKKGIIQNVTRKLIASVLMVAVLATTPVAIRADILEGDSCKKCEKKVVASKPVTLSMPSIETLKRADSEATVNLYRSLRESKVSRFAQQFARNDEMVNASFVAEHTDFRFPAADEWMNLDFAAENIAVPATENADDQLNSRFVAENKGISQALQLARADEHINLNFQAENISTPQSEAFTVADAEINTNMHSDVNRLAKK